MSQDLKEARTQVRKRQGEQCARPKTLEVQRPQVRRGRGGTLCAPQCGGSQYEVVEASREGPCGPWRELGVRRGAFGGFRTEQEYEMIHFYKSHSGYRGENKQ